MFRKILATSCIAVLTVFVLPLAGCGPANSTTAKATAAYWAQLRAIVQQRQPLKQRFEKATTPEEMIVVMREGIDQMDLLLDQIRVLNVTNVDGEVIQVVAEKTLILQEAMSVIAQLVVLIEEYQALGQHASSLEAGLEAFMRGLLGDPLGKQREVFAQSTQIEKRRDQLMTHWQQLDQRSNELDAMEIQLRSTLSQRYHREFPSLEE